MNKLITFLAAFFLLGGVVKAEVPLGSENPAEYRVYKATDVQTSTNKISNSAYLHKVIISSGSTAASTLDIYNGQSASNKVMRIQTDSTTVSGPTEMIFDLYMSSGIYTDYTSTGGATVIYSQSGAQQNYKVWASSFIINDAIAHRIGVGPILVHKIIILKKGAGTCVLGLFNQDSASPTDGNRVANIDLAGAQREYVLDAMLPVGLTLKASGAGSTVPEYIVIYKKNSRRDSEYWNIYHSTFTQTNKAIFAGEGIFGGILNGVVDTAGDIKVYDSNGTASKLRGTITSDTQFSRIMYDVNVSSGLTFTNTGTGGFSILWRRR